MQTLTELHQETTIISIDGVGVRSDLQNAMMEGIQRMGDGDQIFPFANVGRHRYSTLEPDRVTEAHTSVAEELWSHAPIQVHFGTSLEPSSSSLKGWTVVWKGDPHLPPPQQGSMVPEEAQVLASLAFRAVVWGLLVPISPRGLTV